MINYAHINRPLFSIRNWRTIRIKKTLQINKLTFLRRGTVADSAEKTGATVRGCPEAWSRERNPSIEVDGTSSGPNRQDRRTAPQ